MVNAQDRKTKAMRQWNFNEGDKIDEKILLAYVKEAIDNEKKGLKIKPTKKPLVIPTELQQVLDRNMKIKKMFETLTLTKKREFAEYIESAKKQETKNIRLQKIIPMILNNIGLNDKYRNC